MELGLTKEDYKLFLKDALSNSIVVGGKCKNNCIFCSCKAQKAAGLKNWTNYISLNDLNSILDIINVNKIIHFGEGPSFLSCEPFQHTKYLDFLEVLNTHFTNTLKRATTIGTNVNPNDYDRLRKMNIEFIVSVNTFNKKIRSQIMKTTEKEYYNLIDFLKNCQDLIYKISLFYFNIDTLQEDLSILNKIN